MLVLNLTINQPTSSLQVVSECSAYTWPVNNTEYTATGIYTVVIPNTANCDSTITLDLTISQPTSSTQTVTTCGSYLWGANNTEYNTTGVYSTTIPNAANCDSVITLNLTVNQSTTATVSETACGNYLWAINGQNYDESGVYIAVIPNAANCDSTITLNLTITEIPVTITANGGMFSTNLSGVTYQWINCDDNTEVDGATGQIFTPTVNGNYALVVDNGSCTDTSNCLMINNVGIESIKSNNARVYPNPVESELNVHFVEVESGTIKVLDLHGKLVSEYQFDGKETMMIDLSNDAPGVYLIHLNTTNNTSVTRIMKK